MAWPAIPEFKVVRLTNRPASGSSAAVDLSAAPMMTAMAKATAKNREMLQFHVEVFHIYDLSRHSRIACRKVGLDVDVVI